MRPNYTPGKFSSINLNNDATTGINKYLFGQRSYQAQSSNSSRSLNVVEGNPSAIIARENRINARKQEREELAKNAAKTTGIISTPKLQTRRELSIDQEIRFMLGRGLHSYQRIAYAQ